MKVLGVLTQNFGVYYELVKYLKEADVPFVSLAFGEPIPLNVGVVLTTMEELGRVPFPDVLPWKGSAQNTVDLALEVLKGRPQYRTVVVGVDPGERPGIAVYGDGRLLRVEQVQAPELVLDEVARAIDSLSADLFIVRIGDGAGTLKDRTINELLRSDRTSKAIIEEVDETHTSPAALTQGRSDIAAAKAIARAQGRAVRQIREIRPSEGEMRDVQRKSRIASNGDVTISKTLARDVVKGALTLDEAIARQRATGVFSS